MYWLSSVVRRALGIQWEDPLTSISQLQSEYHLTIDAVVMADDATGVYIVKQELADP
jgi:hypothetical protein